MTCLAAGYCAAPEASSVALSTATLFVAALPRARGSKGFSPLAARCPLRTSSAARFFATSTCRGGGLVRQVFVTNNCLSLTMSCLSHARVL